MKLYFVRHGESEANLIREISNRGWKHPLTEKGRQQAQTLAAALEGVGAVKIYTSPLMRAVQTAQVLAERLHLDYEITPALREYDCGVIEGRSDPEAWELHRRVREDWLLRGLYDERIAEGESFNDIRERFLPFIEGLLAGADDGSLILVGHGGLYVTMLPLILPGVTSEWVNRQPFPNTGWVLAERTPSGSLACLEWCGAPFSGD